MLQRSDTFQRPAKIQQCRDTRWSEYFSPSIEAKFAHDFLILRAVALKYFCETKRIIKSPRCSRSHNLSFVYSSKSLPQREEKKRNKRTSTKTRSFLESFGLLLRGFEHLNRVCCLNLTIDLGLLTCLVQFKEIRKEKNPNLSIKALMT